MPIKPMLPIAISAARNIAQRFGYDQVIVIGRRVGDGPDPHGEHCTTYGRNEDHCRVAAMIGNFLKYKVMQWKPVVEANPLQPEIEHWKHRVSLAENECDGWRNRHAEVQQQREIAQRRCGELQEELRTMTLRNETSEHRFQYVTKALDRSELDMYVYKAKLAAIEEEFDLMARDDAHPVVREIVAKLQARLALASAINIAKEG